MEISNKGKIYKNNIRLFGKKYINRFDMLIFVISML